MSNQKMSPGTRKPAAPAKGTRAATSRRAAPAPARRVPGKQEPDRFGLYFVVFSVVGIFLFGAMVWGLRSTIGAAPAATPTVETISQLPVPPAEGSPAITTPLMTPTLAAPDALNSGAYADTPPVSSIVTDTEHMDTPAKLPAALPQPRADISDTVFDLGQVDAAAVLTRELTVANTGAGDLVILKMATDCACLSAHAAAGKLHSGTRTRITLTYDASQDDAPSGDVTHKLVLATTDGQSPLTTVEVDAIH